MSGASVRQRSILIVSNSERFDVIVRKTLSRYRFTTIDFRKNTASARRRTLETQYDIVVINAPLPDEFGHEFALDLAEKSASSVLLVVPPEIYENVLEHVTDYGILVVPKTAPLERIDPAIRFLLATRGRVRQLERQLRAAAEKMEELRIVSKAKLLLVEKKHMTEDDAHRYIGKQAMDNGLSRKAVAQEIIEDLE